MPVPNDILYVTALITVSRVQSPYEYHSPTIKGTMEIINVTALIRRFRGRTLGPCYCFAKHLCQGRPFCSFPEIRSHAILTEGFKRC